MAERITRESWDLIAEEIINIVEDNRDFGFDEFAKRELKDFLTGEDIIDVIDDKEESTSMSDEYWVSCEEYVYFRMKVNANSPEEAREKTRKMISDGSYKKFIEENGDGDVEIKGFCDEDGLEMSYGEDSHFWDYDEDDEDYDDEEYDDE